MQRQRRHGSAAKCNGSAATLVAQLESLGGSVLAEQTFELHSTDCGTWTKLDFARAPCMQVLTMAPCPPAQARGQSSTLPSRPRRAPTAWASRLIQTPEVHCE